MSAKRSSTTQEEIHLRKDMKLSTLNDVKIETYLEEPSVSESLENGRFSHAAVADEYHAELVLKKRINVVRRVPHNGDEAIAARHNTNSIRPHFSLFQRFLLGKERANAR